VETTGQEVTGLLSRMRAGDSAAENQLFELVFVELRHLAQAVFSSQEPGHTLQPTALVHEAWLKLVGNLGSIQDRRHFFVVAGKAMRQVLTDHARGRRREKRGGALQRVTLHSELHGEESCAIGLLELDESLNRLAKCNARLGRVTELRLFSGLTIQEAAETLGVSPRTVEDDWAMAKAWLRRDLGPSG
jgi:RNA polymerase sigma factor (TIGR02999 family)